MKYSVRVNLLPTPRSDGTHTLRMRVSWAGQRVSHCLDHSIPPQDWDAASGKPRRTQQKALREVDQLTASVDHLFDLCHVERRTPTATEVRTALGEETRQGDNGKLTLSATLQNLARDATFSGGWADNTRRNFRTLTGHVSRWRGGQLLDTFTSDDMQQFCDWLFSRGIINSTAQKYVKQLRLALRAAAERGMCAPLDAADYRPHYRHESENDVVYLTRDELARLVSLDLSGNGHLDRARDLFLFLCFSGLRYSDAAKLRRSDIYADHFRVVTKKTSEPLRIELNATTTALLSKYASDNPRALALPVMANQQLNTALKTIGQLADIVEPVRRVWWVRSQRHEESVPKWQVLTSHCGRRTFVVTALSLDISSEVIMRWTGHRDHKTMRPYIAIVDEQKKRQMEKFDRFLTEKLT